MASIGISGNPYGICSSPIPTDPCYENYGGALKMSKENRKSPIPKDPVYSSPTDYKISAPKPRVKPEALAIARSHQGKDLAYLFNPEFKVIPIGVKQTQRESRDHGKDNYRRIKEIQKANREKQIESSRSQPVKAVYKPDKFDHIQSKVAQQMQTPASPRPISSPKLRRSKSSSDIEKLSLYKVEKLDLDGKFGKRSASTNKRRTSSTGGYEKPHQQKDSLTVSKIKTTEKRPCSTNISKRPASARNRRNENSCDDDKRPLRPSSARQANRKQNQTLGHIALNKQAIQNVKVRKNPTDAALEELKAKKEKEILEHKRGNVPKYLRDRQNEWRKAEEVRIANIPDPTIPKGHSLMAEEERIKTLSMLQNSQKDMLEELRSIPLSRDSFRIKMRKDVLERKLQEVDTALKIFSRPRVFIKDE